MQYVVCYDIADDACAAVQESVFVANLEEAHAGRMGLCLRRLVHPDLDLAHFRGVCRLWAEDQGAGGAETVVDREFYVIWPDSNGMRGVLAPVPETDTWALPAKCPSRNDMDVHVCRVSVSFSAAKSLCAEGRLFWRSR